MIEYKPSNPEPAVKERVIINGEDIGEVWPRGGGYEGYYCSLYPAGLEKVTSTHLWGCGLTKEEAIKDAVADGRKKEAAYRLAADWLEAADWMEDADWLEQELEGGE
jgi:hypothetical protein